MTFDTAFDVDRLADLAGRLAEAPAPASAARADGYPSTVAWLRESCRMLGSRASERVLVARQLRRLPETARRFTGGSLGYSTVKVLARVVKNLTDGDTGKTETLSVILQKCRTRLAYLPLESFQLKEAATKLDISARSRTRLKIGHPDGSTSPGTRTAGSPTASTGRAYPAYRRTRGQSETGQGRARDGPYPAAA